MRIWKSDSPRNKNFLYLTREATIVICMTATGVEDREVIAANIGGNTGGRKAGQALRFVGKVLRSTNPVIAACLKSPPPELKANIPRAVRCCGCGCKISVVPCVNCSSLSRSPVYTDNLSDIEMRPFGQPTRHWPGSPAKVLVLARRLEQGELLWNPDDEKPETPDEKACRAVFGFDPPEDELDGQLVLDPTDSELLEDTEPDMEG